MILVHGSGAVTAMGLSASQTCAAIRAGVSGITASLPATPPAPSLPAAVIPARAELKHSAQAWLASMAVRALGECLASHTGDTRRLALLIAIPEAYRGHPGVDDGSGRALVANIVGKLGQPFSPQSRILRTGPAFLAQALEAASTLFERGEIDGALIGGTDSMLDDVNRLDDEGRAYAARNPFGVIAGEAAAFILVSDARRPLPIPVQAGIPGYGCAVEPDHVLSGRNSVGNALRTALDGALERAAMAESAIGWRITDVNGERYRTWESGVFAARQYRSHREGLPTLHVPAFSGDVGSAGGILGVIVAATALARGYAPSPVAVCESASEEGLRAACLVIKGDSPGQAQAIGSAGGAVIARQLLHLPHDVAWLRLRRSQLVRGAGRFAALAEHDERLAANIALMQTFNEKGAAAARAAMADGDLAAGYFLAQHYIMADDRRSLAGLTAQLLDGGAENLLVSAYGWVSPAFLRGIVREGLAASDPLSKRVALAACEAHRVDPGNALPTALASDDIPLLRRALKAAGSLGLAPLCTAVERHLDHADETVRFLAARSALLLGNRGSACDVLSELALGPSPFATEALVLAVQALPPAQAHALLTRVSTTPAGRRLLIVGAGIAGDARYVSWLIRQMEDKQSARLAGAALALLTGLDLANDGLEDAASRLAQRVATTPGDDSVLAEDPDDALPWPDKDRIAEWWAGNGACFPEGLRHFVGVPVSPEACLRVMRSGTQQQRIIAARYLSLMQTGTPLFNTAAPAWRQKRLLDKMG